MKSKIKRLAAILPDTIIRYRLAIICFSIFIVIFSGIGITKLEFTSNYRALFGKNNPELAAFNALQNVYAKNDNILFVIRPLNNDIFTKQNLSLIEELTKAAWQIPYSSRVDSITNFQHTIAQGDNLIVDNLIRNPASLSDEELNQKKHIALKEPLLVGSLISIDAKTAGVNVTLQYPEKENWEVPESVEKAREIAADLKKKYPDVHIALTGVSMLNNAFVESGKMDAITLIPIMYLLLIIVMIITLRSFLLTVANILVIGFSVIVAMGIAGYASILLTPMSIMAPTVILTLSIADSIHIIVSMMIHMRKGLDKSAALKESLRINILPVTITSLTTAVGFLTLNFSDSPPYHDLGNISAIGILAAWFFSLTFLPALISLMPLSIPKIKKSNTGFHNFSRQYAKIIINYRKHILIVIGLLSLVLLYIIPKIELNDQWVNYFDHRIEFRNDAEFGMKHLSGVYIIEYSIEAKDSGGVSDPEYLKYLDKFASWLRSQDGVKHVYSYSDIIKRLNKNMHGDNPVWFKIPEDRELAAQYLLLYEISLPFGLDLNDRINIDKSSTRLSVSLGNFTTREVNDFVLKVQKWMDKNLPDYMQAEATGPTIMFTHIAYRNITSMLRGNVIAIVAISIILIFALKNFKLGLLSILPNGLPILMTFGIWIALIGPIGIAAATVTAMSLGIVVDDTVHFLVKYLKARREKNLDQAQAIIYTFETVGLPLLITTIILTLGFCILMLSSFLVNFQMGLFTAITIVIALFLDFTLLPALLLTGYKPKKGSSVI